MLRIHVRFFKCNTTHCPNYRSFILSYHSASVENSTMNYTAVRNFNKKLSRVEKTVCRAAVVRRSEDNEVFSEDLRHKDLEDDTCIRYDEET